jgi:hypothetical protein
MQPPAFANYAISAEIKMRQKFLPFTRQAIGAT